MGWLATLFVIGLGALLARSFGLAEYQSYFGYETAAWLSLITYLAWSPLVVFVLRVALRILFRVRKQFIDLPVTEASAKSVRRAFSLVGATALWYTLAPIGDLPFPDRIVDILHFVLVASLVWLVVSVWEGFCDSLTIRHTNLDHRAEKLLIPVTRKLVRVVLIIGGGLVLLSTYEVDWKSILAGLGLGGLVMALAAKDSVENIFGSITILFDMPFALGDWVKIDKIDGVVEEINLRSTRIRTFEDSVITLPNSNLIKASVENMGVRRSRRQLFEIRVAYKSSVDSIQALTKALRDYLGKTKNVAKGRSTVSVNKLGEYSISVLVICYLEVPTYDAELALRDEILCQILRIAEGSSAIFLGGSPVGQPS